MLLEHSRKVALISEPRLQCYFGESTVVYRKQLPTTQHAEFPDVFAKGATEMLRKTAAQIHWVHTDLCRHVAERPFLLKRVVKVIQERSQPLWPGGGPVPENVKVSTHEIHKQSLNDQGRIVVRISKLSLKSNGSACAEVRSNPVCNPLSTKSGSQLLFHVRGYDDMQAFGSGTIAVGVTFVRLQESYRAGLVIDTLPPQLSSVQTPADDCEM